MNDNTDLEVSNAEANFNDSIGPKSKAILNCIIEIHRLTLQRYITHNIVYCYCSPYLSKHGDEYSTISFTISVVSNKPVNHSFNSNIEATIADIEIRYNEFRDALALLNIFARPWNDIQLNHDFSDCIR